MSHSLPIPATVKAVLFDAVGTLIRPEPSVASAYWAAGRRLGSRLALDEIQVRFREAFQKQEALDFAGTTSEPREQQRWRAVVSEVFVDIADPAPIFLALWEHFAAAAHWRLYDDAPETWRRLDQRGLRLGIASNFDGRLPAICRELPPLVDCSHLFVSSLMGWRKPSLEFFRTIERELSLHPHELLLVGDDLHNDYFAAKSAGWHAVLIDRDAQKSDATAHNVLENTIADLRQLR